MNLQLLLGLMEIPLDQKALILRVPAQYPQARLTKIFL